jgi:hypothetical protein
MKLPLVDRARSEEGNSFTSELKEEKVRIGGRGAAILKERRMRRVHINTSRLKVGGGGNKNLT